MTVRSLAELIEGREQVGVEFKGPGPLSNMQLRAQVVRAMLGLANHRDGGTLVLGVDAAPGRFCVEGLTHADAQSWDRDQLADAVAAYADPSVRFDVALECCEEKTLVVINVLEFDDVPVLCKKSWGDVLSEGALYVRGRRKPETTAVRTNADMRDVLDLAVEKRLRAYVGMAERSRVRLAAEPPSHDSDAFDRQAGDL